MHGSKEESGRKAHGLAHCYEDSTYETEIGRFRLPFRLETSPTKSSSSDPASSPLTLWPPQSSSGLPLPSSGCILTLTVEAGGDTPWATLIAGPGEEDMAAGPGDMDGQKEEGLRLVAAECGCGQPGQAGACGRLGTRLA